MPCIGQDHTFCSVWFWLILWAIYVTQNREKSRLSYLWMYSVVGFPSRLPICIMHASVWIALTQVDSYNFLLIVMEHSYLMVLSSSHKMQIDVIDITLNNWCDVHHFLVYPHSTTQNITQVWLFSMKAILFEILTLSSEFNTFCYALVSVRWSQAKWSWYSRQGF